MMCTHLAHVSAQTQPVDPVAGGAAPGSRQCPLAVTPWIGGRTSNQPRCAHAVYAAQDPQQPCVLLGPRRKVHLCVQLHELDGPVRESVPARTIAFSAETVRALRLPMSHPLCHVLAFTSLHRPPVPVECQQQKDCMHASTQGPLGGFELVGRAAVLVPRASKVVQWAAQAAQRTCGHATRAAVLGGRSGAPALAGRGRRHGEALVQRDAALAARVARALEARPRARPIAFVVACCDNHPT